MNKSIFDRILETVLSGLLPLPQLSDISVRRESTDSTIPTHVKVTLAVPGGYGGQGSISLDLTLPYGETALIGYLHCLSLTLLATTDSLSTSLNMVQRILSGATTRLDSSSNGNTRDGTTSFKTSLEDETASVGAEQRIASVPQQLPLDFSSGLEKPLSEAKKGHEL